MCKSPQTHKRLLLRTCKNRIREVNVRMLQVVTFVPVFERVIFEYAVHFRVISGDINQLDIIARTLRTVMLQW